MIKHCIEILHIQQQHVFIFGEFKGDGQNALLSLIKVHEARQKRRPHFCDCGADGVALLAVKVPEDGRHGFIFIAAAQHTRIIISDQADFLRPCHELFM